MAESLDKQMLIECIGEEIESFPDALNEYQRGAKAYNIALLEEIQSGRFDSKQSKRQLQGSVDVKQYVYVVYSPGAHLCEVFSTLEAAEEFRARNNYTQWLIAQSDVRSE